MSIDLLSLRSSLNLTQEQVSKRSGISRTHYTQIENGGKTPSVKVAKKIAIVLNFDWTLFFK